MSNRKFEGDIYLFVNKFINAPNPIQAELFRQRLIKINSDNGNVYDIDRILNPTSSAPILIKRVQINNDTPKQCDNCGTALINKNTRARFCKDTCRSEYHRNK